ncbi:MAG: M14 family metallopeptidase [Candidatus Didemnitutus sp.]|nr:M14 family metallopeptidase [Candidatus Didemnitutus sp.]
MLSVVSRFALAILGVGSSLSAAPTTADFLPPALPWSGASETLIAPPTHPWVTPAELTDLTDSPNYDDTIAWLQKLADASPLVSLQRFGRSPQGRLLVAVIASRSGVSEFGQLPATGLPTLLAQAGIHSGEIDGKDAGMMLLRDLAFGGKAALLDHANFLFVPIFNADGHERRSEWNRPNQRGPIHQGWRTTAQNLNLNRDYMKAAAPEMRAMLRLIQLAQPSLYLDLHVTDGIDYQYDITYGFAGRDGRFAWSPQSGAWLEQHWRPAMDAALSAAGHIPARWSSPPMTAISRKASSTVRPVRVSPTATATCVTCRRCWWKIIRSNPTANACSAPTCCSKRRCARSANTARLSRPPSPPMPRRARRRSR